MDLNPLLSIGCVTYNHEKFIAQALDSFLMQKTDFEFEILVSDDASQDETPHIIRRYAERYPDKIRPILHRKNLGPGPNFVDNLSHVRGRYVAICEGDDFWTDPTKLQKQVDFLRTHTECSLCFHPVTVHYDDDSREDSVFPDPGIFSYVYRQANLNLDILARANFIQTNSVVYRWRFQSAEEFKRLYPSHIVPGDWFLHLLHAERGELGFLPDVMATYRRHPQGRWLASGGDEPEFWIKNGLPHLGFFQAMDIHFNRCLRPNYEVQLLDVSIKTLKAALYKGEMDLLKTFHDRYKEYYYLTQAFIFQS